MIYRNIHKVVNFHVLQKRFYKRHVRVRFAPSPTGHLHLGGLRTALYNYLFARANGGSFVLRIEDTDKSRLLPSAVEKLQDDLLWAGIIPDEDPIRGGPVGPYIQSKRLEIYKEHVTKLLNNKSAYYCFCSEKRLDLLRHAALKNRQVPKYDNRCRHLSEEELKEKLKKGEQYCIRFKLASEPEVFEDMVYGRIAHDVAQTEGDPVIVKADGYPTYHFANVVDDHVMGISHVLRGIEWQVSTPKHIMLYRAFGWTPPQFGHLPLILNADGSKLSKRHSDESVDMYRKQGIFPLPLINYITFAGGGFVREQGVQHLYSYEELIKQFNVSEINVNSGRLMPEKLLEYNKLEVCKLIANEKNDKFLIERVRKLVRDAFPKQQEEGSLQLDEQYIMSTLKWAQNRICTLQDLVTTDLAFLWIIPSVPPNISQSGCLSAIKSLNDKLTEIDIKNFNKDWLVPYLRELANNNGIPFSTLMKTLRTILSGLKEGPAVVEMMEILGKDNTLQRLRRTIS